MWTKVNNRRVNLNEVNTYYPDTVNELGTESFIVIFKQINGGTLTCRFETKELRDGYLRDLDRKLKITL